MIIIGLCISVTIIVSLAVVLLGIILRMRIKQKNIVNLDEQAPGKLVFSVLSINYCHMEMK